MYNDEGHLAQRSTFIKWEKVDYIFFFCKCKCNNLKCIWTVKFVLTALIHCHAFEMRVDRFWPYGWIFHFLFSCSHTCTHTHSQTHVHKHLSLWVELKDGDRWWRRMGSEERHREQAAEWWTRRTRERFTTGRISEPSVSVTAVRKWGAWPHISLSSERTMGNGLQAWAHTVAGSSRSITFPLSPSSLRPHTWSRRWCTWLNDHVSSRQMALTSEEDKKKKIVITRKEKRAVEISQ